MTRGNLRNQKNQEKIQTQVSKKGNEDRKIEDELQAQLNLQGLGSQTNGRIVRSHKIEKK